jgi:ribonuclease D
MDHANADKRSELRNYRPTRPQHRARSHDDAHTAEEAHDPGDSRANPLVFRGDAKLVTTQRGLLELIERLRAERSFAYDSEFIGELSYLPKLCVIQTATPKEISLIDPLSSEIDLRPFWELIADPDVEKVTHAGQQDLEPVIRHLGRPAQNIFDTQIASGFAGMAYPASLSKLVKEIVGAKLGKGLTFTHWDQRPLSNQQLKYAANDVRYLPAVRAELGRRLDAVGHMGWAMAECAAQCDVGLYRFDPETAYMRVRGAGSLGPVGVAVLKELVIWRDSAARQHDVPPRAFLKDEILIDMSREPIKSVDKLARVRGLPRPVEQAHGAEMVEATRRGLAVPPGAMPESNRAGEESPTDKHRADALWAVVQCLCIGKSIDPDLVSSRAEVGRLHRQLSSKQEPKDLKILSGWRREAVGNLLLRMVSGDAKVELGWGERGLEAQCVKECD